MKRPITLASVLRFVGTLQLIALWLWGLSAWVYASWGWTLATLLLSTGYIMVWLTLNDREAKP